jgi:hypothetical protein
MARAATVPSSPACPWTTTVEPGLRSAGLPCWVTPTVVDSDVDTLTSAPCAVLTYPPRIISSPMSSSPTPPSAEQIVAGPAVRGDPRALGDLVLVGDHHDGPAEGVEPVEDAEDVGGAAAVEVAGRRCSPSPARLGRCGWTSAGSCCRFPSRSARSPGSLRRPRRCPGCPARPRGWPSRPEAARPGVRGAGHAPRARADGPRRPAGSRPRCRARWRRRATRRSTGATRARRRPRCG